MKKHFYILLTIFFAVTIAFVYYFFVEDNKTMAALLHIINGIVLVGMLYVKRKMKSESK